MGCGHVGQQLLNITSLAKTGKAELATGGIHNKKPHETLGAWSEELLRSTVSENKRNALENYMCEAFSRNNYKQTQVKGTGCEDCVSSFQPEGASVDTPLHM